MTKYIDAEKLRAEVERLYKQNKCDFDNGCNEDQCYGYDLALDHIKKLIDSLQKKQPEIDLEKEFTSWWLEEKDHDYQVGLLYERYPMVSKKLARHFYELRKNNK